MSEYTFTEEKLEELIIRASRRGARQALEEVGLHDDGAGDDIRELRGVLNGWRVTKSTAWKTFVSWVTKAAIILFLTGLCVKMGWTPWSKP